MTMVKFNPTATAIQYTGTEESKREISSLLTDHKITDNPDSIIASLADGTWVVSFMGGMMVMTDEGMRVAQGYV